MTGALILVTGGSGSGKSAWSEQYLLSQCRGRAVYLATMAAEGAEAWERIQRHRAMRAAHGCRAGREFVTIEREVDIGGADVRPGDSVLLEDLGNLLANEIWSPAGAGDQAEEAILRGMDRILDRADLLVVVSSDIFSDGGGYDAGTERYIRALGRLHQILARRARQVVEVVCGIPLMNGL